MGQMKTPGVYILEKDAFPNSVVEVATAVPAFIGYTARADNGGKSLLNKPFRVTSFSEYLQYFGGAPEYKFTLAETTDDSSDNITVKGKEYSLSRTGTIYRLFDAMKFFFQNGGGPCYVVSVGTYGGANKADIKKGMLDGTDDDKPGWGLPTLEKEQEPTMVVIPDALSLDKDACYNIYQQVLAHCKKMMSRIGVFDVFNGYKDRKDPSEDVDVITAFRDGIGTNALNYGTAYYPWINTSIIQDTEVSFRNLTDDSLAPLAALVLLEHDIPDSAADGEDPKTTQIRDFINLLPTYTADYVNQKLTNPDMDKNPSPDDLNKTLIMLSPAYNTILKDVQKQLNLMPPASAMAGVYTMVDNTRGVWKAPANVSLNASVSPAVNITFADQEELNMPLNGKAVNAIRAFVGEGNLVWGARTLDGNSQDWRYINVRRTLIMLEQSIQAAAKAYVFEPNDANTWITIKSMIENFLYIQWKKGALVGSKPDEAYAVLVGLGSTMTGDDILNGIMRITVLVAVSRPAEFIEITFQQQMQKS